MRNQTSSSIIYPRRSVFRKLIRVVAGISLRFFVRLKIYGSENLPKQGPIILAGNHAGVLEAAVFCALSPNQVEFLGNGDIPFDPRYAWLVKAYGFIPVNRGNLDRVAMQKSLDVLAKGGTLGIFPEGGIWAPGRMEAKLGVALLSQRSGAGIIPIGLSASQSVFSGRIGFRRPVVEVRIGKIIPPVYQAKSGVDSKDDLRRQADRVLHEINLLIPGVKASYQVERESCHLEIKVMHTPGQPDQSVPMKAQAAEAYARFILTPVLTDALFRNVKLPIRVLARPVKKIWNSEYQKALEAILAYLKENPGFFTYRFGMQEGLLIPEALQALITCLKSAQAENWNVLIRAYSDSSELNNSRDSREIYHHIFPDRN